MVVVEQGKEKALVETRTVLNLNRSTYSCHYFSVCSVLYFY